MVKTFDMRVLSQSEFLRIERNASEVGLEVFSVLSMKTLVFHQCTPTGNLTILDL
jgi:hypothetical protein